ncbi:hydroxyethylthiazole kinase [Haloparvum alkalitolerans]|uniref:hydroxyethylthiazole kinase n=1 Tax=Haloparvum alkalitolerans TaxID=1042953 RepID=UPI003CEDFA41
MTDPTDGPVAATLAAVADEGPLVQHLTNEVTMSETANVTLHWNALPVMADAPSEAAEMATGADAVLLNTGRATADEVDAMVEAGAAANDAGTPVVLDPVGYGATSHRVSSVGRILDAIAVDAIKGNAGEIGGLAAELVGTDATAEMRGVESVGTETDLADAARALATETGAVVLASGAVDVVADATAAYAVRAGHERMGTFVGSGCMLGSTVAAFAAVAPPLRAAVHASAVYGLAGERAAAEASDGPATYRTAFMDTVAAVADDRPAVDLDERIERA